MESAGVRCQGVGRWQGIGVWPMRWISLHLGQEAQKPGLSATLGEVVYEAAGQWLEHHGTFVLVNIGAT